jgi:hypothetical protein
MILPPGLMIQPPGMIFAPARPQLGAACLVKKNVNLFVYAS